MKISLIYPLLSRARSLLDENKQYWPPLGLAYIAAVLEKKGHSVQILDRDLILRRSSFDFDKTDTITLGLIKDFGAQIVGFSATTPNISDINFFSSKIKSMLPGMLMVIGGPHCSGEPVETLEICKNIDVLVRGKGKITIQEIASGALIDGIAGLTYRSTRQGIVSNIDRPLIEALDELPFPARHLLDMDYYTRPSRFTSRNHSFRTTHIFTARGCPYNCHYCAGPLMGRMTVRYHSAHRLIDEIKELISKYSVEAIYFADDMFLSNKKRAMEIIDLFITNRLHKKISWIAQINPNVADKELLSAMKEAGCIHVEYGFESGSQRVLGLMNKRTNVLRNKEVVKLTRKVGLHFQGNFIVGYPGETEDDFAETVSFIRETRPNMVSMNLFMPLQGTDIYRKLKQSGCLNKNWDDFGNPDAPYINYADMPKSRFEELYFRAKLKVVLPINLFNFIKSNLLHPLRLIYVLITQFKGVLKRAFKAAAELKRIGKKHNPQPIVLLVAYHSITYPIMESQGISYIKKLSHYGIQYFILTYETRDTLARYKIADTDLKLQTNWHHLYYHKNPRLLATLFDVICGMWYVFFIVRKSRINIVHARGLVPAVIAFLPAKIMGVKFFFDTRGLLADKYVGGGLLKNKSLTYRVMRFAENFLIQQSDSFTVETIRHAQVIRNSNVSLSSKMEVIPSCVDLDKFKCDTSKPDSGKFKLAYIGKCGSWYMLDEMFDFFRVLLKISSQAVFMLATDRDQNEIFRAAMRKGIPEDSIVVKNLSHAEVAGFLSRASAGIFFINPYKRYNSSPTKYGEYLACGLPVVINSGIGDTEEITTKMNIGVIINTFSEASYESAARKLLDLCKDATSVQTRCKQAAEELLSLKKGAEKYRDIFQHLLKI